MPIYIWYDPNNPANQYMTATDPDPNVPAGYVYSQGSDGAQPMPMQVYVAGINSGGYPPYTSDETQATVNPKNPNGILS